MDELIEMIYCVSTWFPLGVIIGIATLLWYLTKRENHWKQVGIPYVASVPFLGSMATLFANQPHEVEVQRYKEKGRIYGTYEGSRPNITIAVPDILKDIFVKDFQFFTCRRSLILGNRISDNMIQNLMGEQWKKVRTLVTPAFSTGKIKRMTSIFLDSAEALTRNFKDAARDGKPLDMKKLFGTFTMDVIASTAFGTKIASYSDPENPFVRAARGVFSRAIPWRFMFYFLFPGLMKFLKIGIFPPGVYEFFEDITKKIIEERRRSGQRRNDFLQLMMDAGEGKTELEEEAQDEKEEGHDQIFKPHYRSKSLTNDEMIAQCIAFFLAGYDSVASVLSFTVYELALNPDVQDKLIAEIDEATGQKGELNYDAVAEMKYLDNVISEVLRKYPPGLRAERLAEADYVIKGRNITVRKGMIVQVPVYAMHHDPLLYPNPENFDPSRFSPEQNATRHPFTYLPFGAGPRNCIARRFAQIEVKTCIAYVLSQCRFSSCSETQVPMQFYRGQILLQPREVMLKVELRK